MTKMDITNDEYQFRKEVVFFMGSFEEFKDNLNKSIKYIGDNMVTKRECDDKHSVPFSSAQPIAQPIAQPAAGNISFRSVIWGGITPAAALVLGVEVFKAVVNYVKGG